MKTPVQFKNRVALGLAMIASASMLCFATLAQATVAPQAGSINWDASTNTLTVSGQVTAQDIRSSAEQNTDNLQHVVFSGAEGEVSITDTDQLTDGIFKGCLNLHTVISQTTVHFPAGATGKASLAEMFSLQYLGSIGDSDGLTALDLSNWDTKDVTDMSYFLCKQASLLTIDVSPLNTSGVTDFSYTFATGLTLNGGSRLKQITFGGDFSTANATSMSYMFADCRALESLDLSTFITSKVTSMAFMFARCSTLTSLDLTHFDTSNVESMAGMFSSLSGVASLDLSGFDTSNVETMSNMFSSCTGLESIDFSHFNTSKVWNMDSMFSLCSSLKTLDLSSFDTGALNISYKMFERCNALRTLDISSFDLSNVSAGTEMFGGPTSYLPCQPSEVIMSSTFANSSSVSYPSPALASTYTAFYNGSSSFENPSASYFSSHPGITHFIDESAGATFPISFYANGGTYADGSNMKVETVDYSTTDPQPQITPPATPPTCGDLTFLGWSEQKDAITPTYTQDSPNWPSVATSAITYYAVWSEPQATFSPNGGVWPNTESTDSLVTQGKPTQAIDLPNQGVLPQKSGFVCLGWATTQTASTPTLEAGVTPYGTSNQTFYAVWQAVYTTTFSLPEGASWQSQNPENVEQTGASTDLVKEPDNGLVPTQQNKVFLGFYLGGDTTKTKYEFGKTTFGTNNQTFTAVFGTDTTYTFSLPEGATWATGGNAQKTTSGLPTDTVTAPDSGKEPVQTGKSFVGFYTEGESPEKCIFGTDTYGDVAKAYVAKFVDTYQTKTITFSLPTGATWDGSATAPKETTGLDVSSVTAPNGGVAPQKEHATFIGWNTQADAKGTWLELGTTTYKQASAAYVACFEDDIATTFSLDGKGTWSDGSSSNITMYGKESNVVVAPDSGNTPQATSSLEHFEGFYTEAEGKGEKLEYGVTTYTQNTTYYAYFVSGTATKSVVFALPNGAYWQGRPEDSSSKTTQGYLTALVQAPDAGKAPQKENATFIGWFENPDGTGEAFSPGVTTFDTAKAKYWACFSDELTVTFKLEDGATWGDSQDSSEKMVSGLADDTVSAPAKGTRPQKPGYVCIGYFENPSEKTGECVIGYTTFKEASGKTYTATFEKLNPDPSPTPTPDPGPEPSPEPAPDTQTGWRWTDAGWRYYTANDSYLTDGWHWVASEDWGAHWYYFSTDGAMCTGWIWDGNWYYCNPAGDMAYGVWQWIDGAWYGFWYNGTMCTGWIWDSGYSAWFYCYANGVMARNAWVDGYYLSDAGICM